MATTDTAVNFPVDHDGRVMVGESSAMRNLYGMIKKIAYADSRVLITGETGTGRNLSLQPFIITVNAKKNLLLS